MQPERFGPSPTPFEGNERVAPPVQSPEVPDALSSVPTPEQQPLAERREALTGAAIQQAGAPAMPPPMALPQPVVEPPPVAAPALAPASSNPQAADDADVIEKEWVDRAKAVIKQTQGDPYQKEHEVSRLQADYLEKRFGIQVKLPQE